MALCNSCEQYVVLSGTTPLEKTIPCNYTFKTTSIFDVKNTFQNFVMNIGVPNILKLSLITFFTFHFEQLVM